MLCKKIISVVLASMLLYGTSAALCTSSPKSLSVPVLLYHHLTDTPEVPSTQMPQSLFEVHISALQKEGYTGVSLSELRDFVENGTPLPSKPIVITFDDGYMSNYTDAFPVLQKYGMKAVIFIIGIACDGDKTERPLKNPSISHFSFKEAREMIDSGIVSIGSHTFDMHQWPPSEPGRARENMLRWDEESEIEYVDTLENDFEIMNRIFKAELGSTPAAISYPLGKYTQQIDNMAAQHGIAMTFTSNYGISELIEGDMSSLRELRRVNIGGDMSGGDVIALLGRL